MSTFFLHSSPPQLLISSLKCQFYKYCNRRFSHIQNKNNPNPQTGTWDFGTISACCSELPHFYAVFQHNPFSNPAVLGVLALDTVGLGTDSARVPQRPRGLRGFRASLGRSQDAASATWHMGVFFGVQW